MNLLTLSQHFQKLPRLLLAAEAGVESLLLSVADLKVVTARLATLFAQSTTESTYVYVIPPTGPMMAQTLRVPSGVTSALSFEPYVEIPSGSWVVTAGPAIVRGVRVGNMMQASMSDYQGHVCQLKDAASPGIRITVELGG